MSCCNPCDKTVHFDNRSAERRAQANYQKQLEEALEKVKVLEAEKAEKAKNPCCPTFKIGSITAVGEEVIVTFDNCTYLKAPMGVVDESLSKAIVEELSKALEELKAKVEEVAAAFVRKDELVDVQNFAGTVRFKAYPASTFTPAGDRL